MASNPLDNGRCEIKSIEILSVTVGLAAVGSWRKYGETV